MLLLRLTDAEHFKSHTEKMTLASHLTVWDVENGTLELVVKTQGVANGIILDRRAALELLSVLENFTLDYKENSSE